MHIVAKGLYKRFGTFEACKNVDLEIPPGKLVALLGPSGSGKTTLLRLLAGLEYPDAGEIYFDGRLVNHLPPQERNIGFVFQNYALFRHMTVFENIAFGLSVRKAKKDAVRRRVAELLELTGLQGLDNRRPHQLSGGQRQRVAFARALAPQPQLLLLDEPFAALDAKVRKDLRGWLKDMIRRVGLTAVFVTHDQEEAMEMADEIFIIHQGRVEQAGRPQDIYQLPRTPFVASFLGDSYPLQNPSAFTGFESYAAVEEAYFRPEYVRLLTAAERQYFPAANRGTVVNVSYRGNNWHVEADVEGQRVQGVRSLDQAPLRPGDEVYVIFRRLLAFVHGEPRWLENKTLQVKQLHQAEERQSLAFV